MATHILLTAQRSSTRKIIIEIIIVAKIIEGIRIISKVFPDVLLLKSIVHKKDQHNYVEYMYVIVKGMMGIIGKDTY